MTTFKEKSVNRVRLSGQGQSFYPRKGARANTIGVVLGTLPSGYLAVEWPWGIAFNSPSEVSIC